MKKSLLSLAVLGICVAAARTAEPAKTTVTLETIKQKLVGDWYEAGKDGKPTDKLVNSIRVTAGGSAVRDLIFPNTEMEMVTVYTQEGPDLLLKHYCILGNSPLMKADAASTPDKITFKCIGGGNLDLAKSSHMNTSTIKFEDADHITVGCLRCEGGKECDKHEMKLVRKK